ncbi:MAG: H-X9-DG-CTERM domain-containing protein [Candidatus Zipacnadales bacterium]
MGVWDAIIYPRPNGGCNIAFVDGHAKWMSTQGIYGQTKAEYPYSEIFSLRQP